MEAAAFPSEVRTRPCYYDSARIARCAKRGEHIVFMGDSLTRYQWLALAASFHRGVELSDAEFPSLVKEREWRHWMPFYNGSTEALKPNGRCDCHRSFAKPVGSKTIENRFFWLSGGALNLSFIQVLNPEAILGTWLPVGPLSDERHRAQLHDEFAPRWRMRWAECIAQVVAQMQPPPTVLLLNMGLWGPPPNASYLEDIYAVARRAAPRVVWKTTTRMRKSGPTKWLRTDMLARRTFREIFDAARLTRSLSSRDYWDARHFVPHVYNHLNAALLRQLYGQPVQCEEFNHGRCSRSKPVLATNARVRGAPAPGPLLASSADDTMSEAERAASVSSATPEQGWTGVLERPPTEWNTLQTILWLDFLGVSFDAKEFANRSINASSMRELLELSRHAELGMPQGARQKVLGALWARQKAMRHGRA